MALTSLLLFLPDFLLSCWFCLCLAHDRTLAGSRWRMQRRNKRRVQRTAREMAKSEKEQEGTNLITYRSLVFLVEVLMVVFLLWLWWYCIRQCTEATRTEAIFSFSFWFRAEKVGRFRIPNYTQTEAETERFLGGNPKNPQKQNHVGRFRSEIRPNK